MQPANSQSVPKITVVIRSYKRITHLIELIEKCLLQDHPNFEILVIEQTSTWSALESVKIRELSKDERLRVVRFKRLGPAAARNVAVKYARGEILLFIDDDDLPFNTNWVKTHSLNYMDPLCVGVTGREIHEGDHDPSRHDTSKNHRLCLRYSFLRMPRARVRHTKRILGITALQGANTSIRKEVIERVGGWDTDVEGHEENSFDFKFMRMKNPGEHYVFDPDAILFRRFQIPGGLERRMSDTATILESEFLYSHRIIRRYFPIRFYLFYPIYLLLAVIRTFKYMQSLPSHKSPILELRDLLHAIISQASSITKIGNRSRK